MVVRPAALSAAGFARALDARRQHDDVVRLVGRAQHVDDGADAALHPYELPPIRM
jgi:hypothetical protein